MVLLGGFDFPNSQPVCAAVHAIGGSSAVVVAFAFLLADCTGVVGANGMMATGETVPTHVVCELERTPIAVAASPVAANAIATAIAATCIGFDVVFCCHGD